MFKAIIETIENDGYSAKVRIPFFNGYSSSTGSTSDYELYTASICSSPGCDPAYKKGDIVYIDFEDRDYGKPVIIGIFYREDYLSSANINTQSLNVAVSADFPEDVSIGNVGKNNIKSLTRISDNVQAQLTELNGSIKNVSGEIPTKVSQLENDSGYITEDDIPPIPSKVSELENDENFINEDTLNDISQMYIWEVFESKGARLESYDSLDIVDNSTITVYYSNTISTKADGSITLNNYSTIDLTSTSSSTASDSVDIANSTLKGKYIKLGTAEDVYYAPEDSNFIKISYSVSIVTTYYKINLNASQKVSNVCSLKNYIADFSITEYPQSGIKDNYYYYLLDTIGNLFIKDTVNLWVWKKYNYTPQKYSYTESSNTQITNSTSSVNYYYSDYIKVLNNGTIELLNPSNDYVEIKRTSTTTANTYLVGKYINKNGSSTIYYIPTDAEFYNNGYPLYVTKMQTLSGTARIKTLNSYVCDLYEEAYPSDGYIDNYWYEKQYKLINKLNNFESRITALENASTT